MIFDSQSCQAIDTASGNVVFNAPLIPEQPMYVFGCLYYKGGAETWHSIERRLNCNWSWT
jgi:hypothetical protein